MNKKLSQKNKEDIYKKAVKLISLYKEGKLGGEIMPEDANPGLHLNSRENYLYFTLPMALNYQRNSYKLWESAKQSYYDKRVSDIFFPDKVALLSDEELRDKLTMYKVALQPNKQTIIWRTLCHTLLTDFAGDVRNLFFRNDYSVEKIKNYIIKNKKQFPYLSGPKIMNYWLYVMSQYTDAHFIDRNCITVAPDTHVIKASVKLGLISEKDTEKATIREDLSEIWYEVFNGTNLCPIDIHTPLWLWSRNGFSIKLGDEEDELL